MTQTDTLTKKSPSRLARHEESTTPHFLPAADVWETPEQVILRFDMPGVNKEHVDITVDKGTLTVTGKAALEEKGACVYRETRIGDFQRQFTLAENMDTDRISAQMEAGVLVIHVPKAEKAKPKKIQIKAS